MDIKRIHFIREILVRDYRGEQIPTMQFSYDNASYLNPIFLSAPIHEKVQLRQLYERLGGSRSGGGENGTIVIIPNRPWYSDFWDISAGEVRIVESTAPQAQLRHAPARDEGRAGYSHRAADQSEE